MFAERIRLPLLRLRRWTFFGLVALTTAWAVWMMMRTVGAGGITALEVVIVALFTPTFAWIVIPFWTAIIGFLLRRTGVDPVTLGRHRRQGRVAPTRTTTAVVVPIHNESPDAVAARVSAMSASLIRSGSADRFHIHLLSDTTDERVARREEVEWVRLQADHPEIAIHYRRRERNTGRKAGNIGEFCVRCADDYDFMVVLDADSLMTGATLVRLAGLMEANPEIGLLQTVPLPVLQRTLFGRLVQFAGQLYGPVLAAGLSFWQGDAANYWGHNAIVRLEPFTEHCKLPVLSGRPPLGGEVLSHDFVEGALLRRAGWKVVLLTELEGSWEEVPGTVPDYAKRDRRWAQGSLQHLRLLGLRGLHPMARLNFVLGAMGYVSSLLWLLTLVAGTAYVASPLLHGPALDVVVPEARFVVSLLVVTGVILFLPKLLGLVDAMLVSRDRYGGGLRLVAGAGVEALFSVVLAPVMMVYHAAFVVAICAGRSVRWDAQRRDGVDLSWGEAWRASRGPTVVGLIWGGTTLLISPTFFLWMSPIFFGLVLALPLVRWTSRPRTALVDRFGLLSVPTDAGPREVNEVRRAIGRARRLAALPPLRPPVLAQTGDLVGEYGVHVAPGAPFPGPSSTAGRSMVNAERGLFDLRQGRPVLITDGDEGGDGTGSRLIAAVEGLTSDQFERLRSLSCGAPRLVLTRHRLVAMGLAGKNGKANGNGSDPAERAYVLESEVDLHRVVELSCGAVPTEVAERLSLSEATSPERAGLAMVRLGRLLPAVVSFPVDEPFSPELRSALDGRDILEVPAEEADRFVRSAGAEVVPISEAPVPLAEAADSRFILFREGHGLQEHVAILVGDEAEWPDPVPVRLHSACLTGDLFGSLRCDCGEQLRGSMQLFAASGGGVLLYLAQEGRGIGLRNKFRAYTLQEAGLDTIDADCTLGFGPDERRYDVAARILQMIGVRRIELLTNNPEKVRAMEEAGIDVVSRRPLHGTLNRHNLPYVRAKVQRAGHWLGDMLSQPLHGD